MYVTNADDWQAIGHADDWQAIGRAHDDAFGDANPASALVEVQSLIEPELLVEVEATAIVQ